jgi:hypothetical protein
MITSRRDCGGPDFFIRHLTLKNLSMKKGFYRVVTAAIHCYNSGMHAFLRRARAVIKF